MTKLAKPSREFISVFSADVGNQNVIDTNSSDGIEIFAVAAKLTLSQKAQTKLMPKLTNSLKNNQISSKSDTRTKMEGSVLNAEQQLEPRFLTASYEGHVCFRKQTALT